MGHSARLDRPRLRAVYPCPTDFKPPPGSHPPYVCRIFVDPSLDAIDCPNARECLAVGEAGNIVASVDGGATWTSRPSGTYNQLRGIACPSAKHCLAVGGNGPDVWVGNGDEAEHTQPATILASANGGASWKKRSSGTGTYTALYGIACPSAKNCLAVGGGARAGARSWQARTGEPPGTAVPPPARPTSSTASAARPTWTAWPWARA